MAIFLTDIKEAFKAYVELDDDEVIDVLFGAVLANQFPGGHSTNLYLQGASSTGKTEALDLLLKYPKVYELSGMSINSFASGFKNPKEPDKDFSILAELSRRGKNIITFPDFTTLLSMRQETMVEILGQIRKIADGSYTYKKGNQDMVEWQGRVGFMAATTPALELHDQLFKQLGERFLKYRMTACNPIQICDKVFEVLGKEPELKAKAQELSAQFLAQFEMMDYIPPLSDLMRDRIRYTSILVAHSRAPTFRDKYHGETKALPEYEGPGRLVKQLCLIGQGIALAMGRPEVDYHVYRLVKKVALDSGSPLRYMIIEQAYHFPDDGVTRKWVSEHLGVNRYTTDILIDDLVGIGFLYPEQTSNITSKGKTSTVYSLTHEYRRMMDLGRIGDGDKW